MELAVGAPEVMRSVQGGSISNRHQDILEPVPLAPVIVNVSGGDYGNAQPIRKASQGSILVRLSLRRFGLELDEEPVRTKGFEKPASEGLPRGRAVFQIVEERTAPAAREGNDSLVTLQERGKGK
jgi:hypothetical protein